jgi:cytochrome c553
LRIDIDCKPDNLLITGKLAEGHRENYCIPKDNPFVGNEKVLPEYWALGLRNPYRIAFDHKGELWVGDVGSTVWEEVNKVVKGGNYQFPYIEGYETTGKKKADYMVGVEYAPIYTYVHTAYDRSVIGGFVYQGNEFPELQNQYVFADNYSSIVFTIKTDKDRVEEASTIARASQFAQRGVSSIVQLKNGDVLLTTLGRSTVASGEILKLVDKQEGNLKPKRELKQEVISTDEAKTIFAANCARCHGADGKGDGLDVEALGVSIADFSSGTYLSKKSDQFLYDVIEKGGVGVKLSPMMPPWKEILNKAEIDALVLEIKTMSEKNE